VSSAVKKGAIALASLAGLALMAKHRDKLPGLMAKANDMRVNMGYRLRDKLNGVKAIPLDPNQPISSGWEAISHSRPTSAGGLWDKVKKVAKVALPVAGAVGAAYAGNKLMNRKSVMSQAFPGVTHIGLERPEGGWSGDGLSGGTKSLKALKRLGLTGSKKVNSLRHIAGNEVLDSPEYQQSAVAIHDRLKRLPEKSELKQAAYQAGGMLLGAGVSKRKTHSKRNKLLASSALLTLGTKHNKEITGNSLKILRKQRNRAQEMEAYLKSIPMAKNDFYKDRMELAKQNESQPPVDSTPQQPAPGKGIGNIVGLMSKPRRKGTGIKDKIKSAAKKVGKVLLPAAAIAAPVALAAASAYAGHHVGRKAGITEGYKRAANSRSFDNVRVAAPFADFFLQPEASGHSGAHSKYSRLNIPDEWKP
jgi:hypothetical protein